MMSNKKNLIKYIFGSSVLSICLNSDVIAQPTTNPQSVNNGVNTDQYNKNLQNNHSTVYSDKKPPFYNSSSTKQQPNINTNKTPSPTIHTEKTNENLLPRFKSSQSENGISDKIKPTFIVGAGYQFINKVSKKSRPILNLLLVAPFLDNKRYVGLFSSKLLNSWSLSEDSIKNFGIIKAWRLSLGGRLKNSDNKSFGEGALGIDLTGNSPASKGGFLIGLNLSFGYCFSGKYKCNLYGNFYGNKKGDIATEKYKIAPNFGVAFNTIIKDFTLKASAGCRFGDRIAVPVAVKPGVSDYKPFSKNPVWLKIEGMSFKFFNTKIGIFIDHNNLLKSIAEGGDDKTSWFDWIQIGLDFKYEIIGNTVNNNLIGSDFEFCPSLGFSNAEDKDLKFKLSKYILDKQTNDDKTTLEYKLKTEKDQKPLLRLNNGYLTNIGSNTNGIKQEYELEVKDNKVDGNVVLKIDSSKSSSYIDLPIIVPSANLQLFKDSKEKNKNNLIGDRDLYIGDYKDVNGSSIKLEAIDLNDQDIQTTSLTNKSILGITENPTFCAGIKLSSNDDKIKLTNIGIKSISLKSSDWNLDSFINDSISYWTETISSEDNKYLLCVGIKSTSTSNKDKIGKFKYQIKLHPDSDYTSVSLKDFSVLEKLSIGNLVSPPNTVVKHAPNTGDFEVITPIIASIPLIEQGTASFENDASSYMYLKQKVLLSALKNNSATDIPFKDKSGKDGSISLKISEGCGLFFIVDKDVNTIDSSFSYSSYNEIVNKVLYKATGDSTTALNGINDKISSFKSAIKLDNNYEVKLPTEDEYKELIDLFNGGQDLSSDELVSKFICKLTGFKTNIFSDNSKLQVYCSMKDSSADNADILGVLNIDKNISSNSSVAFNGDAQRNGALLCFKIKRKSGN